LIWRNSTLSFHRGVKNASCILSFGEFAGEPMTRANACPILGQPPAHAFYLSIMSGSESHALFERDATGRPKHSDTAAIEDACTIQFARARGKPCRIGALRRADGPIAARNWLWSGRNLGPAQFGEQCHNSGDGWSTSISNRCCDG
jgi:hypothetical protein